MSAANFRGSSVLRDHLAGDNQAAAEAFLMWNKARVHGVLQPVAGLTNRRTAERAHYLRRESGVPTRASTIAVLAWLAYGVLAAAPGRAAAPPERWAGHWVIVKDLGAPGISAMTETEAAAMLRGEIDLGAAAARLFGEACAAPRYTIEAQAIDDYLFGFKLTPEIFHLAGAGRDPRRAVPEFRQPNAGALDSKVDIAGPAYIIQVNLRHYLGCMTMSTIGATLTSTEVAATAEMPVREVNQLIDDRVLPARFVRKVGGRRVIAEDGLVFVFLETIASETLAPAGRRKVGEAMIENKRMRTFADGIVRIDVLRVRREIVKRLDRLKKARAMVSSDPSVMGGLPCFRGTRIPVHDVAGMLRAGDSVDVVLRHYPSLDGVAVELAGIYAEAYPRRGRPPRKPGWREGSVVHKDVVPRKRIAHVADTTSNSAK